MMQKAAAEKKHRIVKDRSIPSRTQGTQGSLLMTDRAGEYDGI